MLIREKLVAALLALGILSAPAAEGAPPPRSREPGGRPLPATVSARLQAILSESVASSGVMGAQAAVRIPGYAAWTSTAGFERPGVLLRTDRMIGTGSITKMYTAIAAMLLVDRRRFGLDDPIGRWFPNTRNVDPRVTVRQLLQHTSGLGDYATNPDFARAITTDRERVWRPEEFLTFIGPPMFAPGASYRTTNTNRLLLELIVEHETKRSLPDFMKPEIFRESPSIWVMGDGPPPAGLATQWIWNGPGQLLDANENVFSPSVFTARREIQASAADIAEFGERVFTGSLLSDGLRTEMFRTVPSDGKVPGETGGGLGIRAYERLGALDRPVFGHSGAVTNDRSLLLFDPVSGIVVAVAMNQGGGHGESHFTLTPALLKAAIEFVESR